MTEDSSKEDDVQTLLAEKRHEYERMAEMVSTLETELEEIEDAAMADAITADYDQETDTGKITLHYDFSNDW